MLVGKYVKEILFCKWWSAERMNDDTVASERVARQCKETRTVTGQKDKAATVKSRCTSVLALLLLAISRAGRRGRRI